MTKENEYDKEMKEIRKVTGIKENEFNLSNWIDSSKMFCRTDKIKEFIRRLKEQFKKGEENIPIKYPKIVLDYNKIIDKLAGKDLI